MYVSLIWFSFFVYRVFRVDFGVSGLVLGWLHCVHWGMKVCTGVIFHQSRVSYTSFQCRPIIYQAFGWWKLIWRALGVFVVGGVTIPVWAWALRS